MKRSSGGGTSEAIEISAVIVLVMFAVFYLNVFLGGWLNYFGILPRTWRGLAGVFFSPLLHANLAHLTANSVSLFILLVILFAHRDYEADRTLIYIWLLSGLGTWIIG